MNLKRSTRRGAATVELAVTLPLLIVIALGTIETCTIIFTKQALQSAAHECARVAADAGGTNSAVQQTLEEFAQKRSLSEPRLVMQPANCASVDAGELLTVTVSANPGGAGFISQQFFGERVEASCTFMKSY